MTRYQYREIGEGEGWRDCSKDAYDAYGRDPHIDTRIKPMAEGCRSAISPCPHQCRDPYTLCAHCDDRQEAAPCNNPDATDYMRRCDIQRMTETERLITDAMSAVERMPGDMRLTDAVSLLFAARTRLADYVDGIPGHITHPVQRHLNDVVRR